MRINTIEIKGFSSYKNYTKIDVPTGIIGIVGTMDGIIGKSNGTGKSSIVKAILFALYGTGSYDRAEEIWNDTLFPNEDAFVRITFELNGNSYVVERGRKGKSSYLDALENDSNVGASVKEAQDFIINLLGMDSKLFLASVFFSQGDLSSFIEMDPKDRKDYIDSVVDLEVWRAAGRDCVRDSKKTIEDIDTAKEKIKSFSNQLGRIDVEVSEIEEKLKQLPLLQKNKLNTEELIKSFQEIDTISKKVDETKTELNTSLQEKEKLSNEYKTIEKNLKDLSFEYSTIEENLKKINSYNIETMEVDLSSLKTNKTQIKTELEQKEKELDKLLVELTYSEKSFSTFLQSKLLIESGKCDRCKRSFSDEEKLIHLTEITKSMDDLNVKIEDFRNRAKNELVPFISVQKPLVEKLIVEITAAEQQIREVNSLKLSTIKEESDYKEKKSNFTTQLKSISNQLIKLELLIKETTKKLEEIEKSLPKKLDKDLNTLNSELLNINSEIYGLTIAQGRLQKVLEDQQAIKNTISEDKKLLKDHEEKLYLLEVLNDAFKNIPTQILKESVINIEKYANDVIRAVFPKFKVKLFEDESKKTRPLIVAFEVDGKYRNYKLLSGGQQSICAIGLRIGFNRIISEKAKVSLNFLVLDEIFGSLDEVNRIEVMKLLGVLVKNFPQILVITHTEESSSFPYTINVHMDNFGVSSIKQI